MTPWRGIGAALAITAGIAAQSVPNGSFEDWDSGEPTGPWLTCNAVTQGYPSYGTLRTTDAVDGSYAAMLVSGHVTIPVLGTQDTTAILMSGTMSGGPVSIPAMGFPYAARPQVFELYYKFVPAMPVGRDTARIYVRLSRLGQTVGTAMLKLYASVPDWTLVQLPISYVLADTPDTALIDITSSLSGLCYQCEPPFASLIGNTLYVDRLVLGNPTAAGPGGVDHADGVMVKGSAYAVFSPTGRRCRSARTGQTAAPDLSRGVYVVRPNGPSARPSAHVAVAW